MLITAFYEKGSRLLRPNDRDGVCTLALWPLGAAFAQGSQRAVESYPTRPIRLVVPFAPGGSSDTITRQIGPRLAEQMARQVVLDNRSGGNGAIGTQIVALAKAKLGQLRLRKAMREATPRILGMV